MDLHGLLSVASKVGTPLALAGIIVIILYALYKQVLALNVFANIGAGPTARLLQRVLDKLFWLALIALVLGAACYLMIALVPPNSPPRSSESTSGGITVGRDIVVGPGAVMQTGPGHVSLTNIQGILPEQFQRLAEELGVTKAALTSFFKILEQHRVPPEDLDAKLREIATHYKALLERIRTLSADDPDIAQLRDAAEKAIHEGNFDRAEQLLNEASAKDLDAAKELQDIMTKRLLAAAEAKATNGALKMTQLAYADAGAYYRRAAAIVPRDEVLAQAEYLNAEGTAWIAAGQYAEAQPPLERALALREKVFGPEHPEVATSLNNLTGLYHAEGRYAAAEALSQRALAIREKVFGPEHPEVATSLNDLAGLYQAQGRYAEAEPLYQQALAIQEKVLGPEHPNVATSLNNLAGLYYAEGRYAEAEPLYQQALAIREKVLGPEHPDGMTVRENYAAFLRATNRDAEAAQLEAREQTR